MILRVAIKITNAANKMEIMIPYTADCTQTISICISGQLYED